VMKLPQNEYFVKHKPGSIRRLHVLRSLASFYQPAVNVGCGCVSGYTDFGDVPILPDGARCFVRPCVGSGLKKSRLSHFIRYGKRSAIISGSTGIQTIFPNVLEKHSLIEDQ